MQTSYIMNVMNHLKSVRSCVGNMHGTAILNATDLVLLVRAGGRAVHMQPQFVYVTEGRVRYTPRFEPEATGFIGWRPYFNKRWELSTEKLRFKSYAQQYGIRTPAYWLDADGSMRQVVIKNSRSSFGVGMRGPFRCLNERDPEHRLGEGEFYEAFVAGRIAKAWYWDGELVVLELRPPPMLRGNGWQSVAELARAQCNREVDIAALAWTVIYQGRSVDMILKAGELMPVDFKYGSPYDAPSRANENVVASHRRSHVGEQFIDAGRAFWQGIPDSIRPHTVFTLDAVVDDSDRVWFLEMNSNPIVHPDLYPAMVESVLSDAPVEPPGALARG